MQLVVLAEDEQWKELATVTAGVEWVRAANPFLLSAYDNAAAFFILKNITATDFSATGKPVFINSVTNTLVHMRIPKNVLRINGWHTFLQRPLWEVAGEITTTAENILLQINKRIIAVKDEPGFIAGSTVAMIINEAYFALGDAISDKTAIDTAMKLGTNYPYGPFEWADKIGITNVYELLKKLSETDTRYTPAPALTAAATQ